jgi:hypothetical protein
MAHKLLNGVTAVGASNSIKIPRTTTHHTVVAQFKDYGVTAVSALILKVQASLTGENNTTVVTAPALAIGSTAERVANGAFLYRINGVNYSKGAVAAGTALPADYDLTTAKYGVILLFINAAGTITYQFPATVQAYDTAALAMAAGDTLQAKITSDLCYIGRVLLYNNTGSTWDSQTDDLTNASDITNAVFMDASLNWYDVATYTFSATDLANQGALFHVADSKLKYIRLYLSTLTGNGLVDAWYEGGV